MPKRICEILLIIADYQCSREKKIILDRAEPYMNR